MLLNLSMKRIRSNRQEGSALVLALFIMIVVTLLGTFLVKMISSSAETIAFEVLGTRAYQAAQIGAQRKLSELFPLSPGTLECTLDSNYGEFTTVKGLENCQSRNVDCIAGPTVDDITYYTITSTGQCDFLGVFTSRTIEVKARSLLD